jgi:hypothetical protein
MAIGQFLPLIIDSVSSMARKKDGDKTLQEKQTDKKERELMETDRRLKEKPEVEPEKKRSGGKVGYKSGGYVKSADGCAQRGKTKGRMV